MKKILVIAFALGAAPVHAQGFSSADLTAAAQQPNASQAETLAHELSALTERLRLSFAYDPLAAMDDRAESERRQLFEVFAPGPGIADARVRWFMSGAIPQQSLGTTTALYNPLARGWILLHWQKTEDSWLLDSAWIGSSGPATWTAETGPYLAALVSDYNQARKRLGSDPAGAVGEMMDRWIGGLAVAMHNPAMRKSVDGVRNRIINGKSGSNTIDLMPVRARQTYWPIAAFTRPEEKQTIIFGSALIPQMLIFADFSAKASIDRLTLVNLDNAGGQK